MTRDEKIKAFTMRVDGFTYGQIGKEFGMTKQAVQQALRYALYTKRAKTYPNIVKWMGEHNMSARDTAAKAGLSYYTLLNVIKGKQPLSKRISDAILRVTGMTYEECFYRPEE